MDLRPYIKTKAQLECGVALIRSNDLFYQPFILADDIEVGEGQNFADRYAGVTSVFDNNVCAPRADVGVRSQAKNGAYFRQCNEQYRQIYSYIADTISVQLGGDISKLSFAEIGCNTGLNLFNLAVRGAKSCAGYDWNDMSGVFSWLNGVLGTEVRFRQGIYNNLHHRFSAGDIPEVDVMINTVFTNHQCDPLQFLSYICDRSRKGVFLWALTQRDDSCAIHYPPAPPHEILTMDRRFPTYFNNDVRISEKLLLLSLKRLGFGEVELVKRCVPNDSWDYFQQDFNMYYARRTSEIRSAYWKDHSMITDRVKAAIPESIKKKIRLIKKRA